MKNLVIVGISDTADRIARFVERYSLYNIIGCIVNMEYATVVKHTKFFSC